MIFMGCNGSFSLMISYVVISAHFGIFWMFKAHSRSLDKPGPPALNTLEDITAAPNTLRKSHSCCACNGLVVGLLGAGGALS